tara:strand:- start:2092 stop:2289 length:198 start_codon:yes stop_codon:yes gene_type:complete
MSADGAASVPPRERRTLDVLLRGLLPGAFAGDVEVGDGVRAGALISLASAGMFERRLADSASIFF